MEKRHFNMRLSATFSGDRNAIDSIRVERLVDGGWELLQLDEKTPGFRIFAYSAFACQLTHLRMQSANRDLLLASCEADFELEADLDWFVHRVDARFRATLRSGEAKSAEIQAIVAKMEGCPVARNLESVVHRTTLHFVPT